MLAVIKFAGSQHIVKKNDIITTNKIDDEVGKEIVIQDVLSVIDEGKVQIGNPTLPNVSVKAKILEQTRDKKVIIFKKRRRKHSRRKNGHRQYITKLQIVDIN
ncbi:50S ribosomal protein L21 [Candidatus Hepatincola sp. Av]